ncbi:MAG: PHP domain-containing protein [Oscillospiraceae bacterium]|nr:PHP domain-containing protein [Oscillospiraceae bacterium]
MSEKAKFACDLHCHTIRSDGCDTPRELIDSAAERGLKVLAITDHDVRPPKTVDTDEGEMDLLEYGRLRGITVLRGCEVSCETQVEDVHIVLLGCDWSDGFFTELEEQVQRSKIESYQRLVELIREDGYPISWEDILNNDGKPIAPELTQKKMIFERLAKIGFAESWSEAKLKCKETPRYQVKRPKPDPLEVIAEAHRCGGIAILAHPYLINEPVQLEGETLSRAEYIERLIEAGLDGIEAEYTYDKTSYSGSLTREEIAREVRALYSGRLAIISGGSDYHADHKKGVKNARAIGEAGVSEEYFYSNPLLARLARTDEALPR